MARILVIDDDQGIRELMGVWLSQDGHEWHAAANGHDGLALLRRAPIDLVITDLVMKYDGLMTIGVIRWEFPTIPIIAMSGQGKARLIQAETAGADRVVAKPFDAAALRTAIREVLSPRA